jgi:preprotein translocase subunit SecA
MRLFASDRISSMMDKLRIPDEVPIEAKIVSRAIERAQTQVESMNFEIRKNVLKYDEVMDKQRHIIYEERRKILEGEDFRDETVELVGDVIQGAVAENANPDLHPEEWDWEQLIARMREVYPTTIAKDSFDPQTTNYDEVLETFLTDAIQVYERREQELGTEAMRQIERLVLLNVIDNRWREHLYEMDYLQEGIGLRAMGQKDPLVEYQREGFNMFVAMQDTIKEDFARYIFHVEAVRDDGRRRREPAGLRQERRQIPVAAAAAAQQSVAGDGLEGEPDVEDEAGPVQQARSEKIPRNAPCPCGSGKKYKLCHGRPGVRAS